MLYSWLLHKFWMCGWMCDLCKCRAWQAAFAHIRCYRLVFGRGGLAHMWAGLRGLRHGCDNSEEKNLPIMHKAMISFCDLTNE